MSNHHPNAFPVLSTTRLTLRALAAHDADNIHFLRSDETVNRFLNRPTSTSTADAIAFIEKIQNYVTTGESYYWAITEKDKEQLIGTICLWGFNADLASADIGYELMPAYQGRGLMQEAVASVVQFAFHHLSLKYITAFTHPENTASTQVLLRNQFIPDTGYRFSTRETTQEELCFYLAHTDQATA
jgi:[ribosomal protein S5]-alanine N-acetyltransferase